jgi:hypothetical protein
MNDSHHPNRPSVMAVRRLERRPRIATDCREQAVRLEEKAIYTAYTQEAVSGLYIMRIRFLGNAKGGVWRIPLEVHAT